MAYFAKLDSNNKILAVLKADNQDILNNGGEQSEQAAKYFEKTVPLNFPPVGVKYVQTSFNNNITKDNIGSKLNLNKDNVSFWPSHIEFLV